MNCNIEILLITWNKHRDVCFNLVMFYNICLLYDVATFYTYDILNVSRVTVWLDWIKNNNIFCILTGPKCKEHKVTITSKLG
jgi:hypothetical protein